MRPRINEVDELLQKGVNVTICNGQLDVICTIKRTEASNLLNIADLSTS
ncbi:hypothetical protein Patl1_29832 [Pistacia atlantica]|uniref:Uncharacterized protein n=1 Tax=Pistacia atlantica TaxID=434234 RepID=A0ACC1AG48_9ROSI|nr:hypothetical protein Patl1_29832 [Pistacia atlantica]